MLDGNGFYEDVNAAAGHGAHVEVGPILLAGANVPADGVNDQQMPAAGPPVQAAIPDQHRAAAEHLAAQGRLADMAAGREEHMENIPLGPQVGRVAPTSV